MELGAHLPLIDFGGNPHDLAHLVTYTEAARDLGFAAVSVNDHLLFALPWLDGPVALAAVVAHSGDMALMTTVALPVVRGPVALAKAFAAIDRLSGGRVVLGVGPGSSAADHEAVGLDFDERWRRLDEAIGAIRALWHPGGEPFRGRYYATDTIRLRPEPAQPGGPPIWVGSWGSEAGLRRVARLGDGWLASAYNTTPPDFAAGLARLGELLVERGRDPAAVPNGLATMWFHVSDDRAEADRAFTERLVPAVHRPAEVLRERLPFGPAEQLLEKLLAYRDAGVERVILWPVADEVTQLERVAEQVVPHLS